MFQLERLIVAFDVDGTLLDHNNKPREKVLALYRAFEALGYEMWVWSGGGLGYAQSCAHRLGLSPDKVLVKDRKLKPHLAFDDIKDTDLGIATVFVPPPGFVWTDTGLENDE